MIRWMIKFVLVIGILLTAFACGSSGVDNGVSNVGEGLDRPEFEGPRDTPHDRL